MGERGSPWYAVQSDFGGRGYCVQFMGAHESRDGIPIAFTRDQVEVNRQLVLETLLQIAPCASAADRGMQVAHQILDEFLNR
jgi:hypothetical protein